MEHNKNSDLEPEYFKGLDTLDKAVGRKYFTNLFSHMKEFETASQDDRKLIDMVFNKDSASADIRKDWFATSYKPEVCNDYSVEKIKISDFITHGLMHYIMSDKIHSIPCIIDGFTPGQHRVFYGAIKRGENNENKVSKFANYG